MADDRNYQEARAVYHNLNLAADRKDWKSIADNISRLGDLVMSLGTEEA